MVLSPAAAGSFQSGAAGRDDGGGEMEPQGAIIGLKAMIINELVSGFLGVAELALPRSLVALGMRFTGGRWVYTWKIREVKTRSQNGNPGVFTVL